MMPTAAKYPRGRWQRIEFFARARKVFAKEVGRFEDGHFSRAWAPVLRGRRTGIVGEGPYDTEEQAVEAGYRIIRGCRRVLKERSA